MSQCDGLRKVLVKPQAAGQGPGHLGYLQRMRKARAIVVAHGGKKYLRLVFEAPKTFAVDDAVAVALKIRAQIAGVKGMLPPQGSAGKGGKRRKTRLLLKLQPFADCHDVFPFRPFCFGIR